MTKVACGLLLALLVGLPGAATGQEPKPKAKYERDLITQEEIRERVPEGRSAYEVIQQLRPHFLRERSTGTMSPGAQRDPIRVYIDGVQSAVASVSLRDVRSDQVIDIKYMNGSDATTRFGTGHMNGAIMVATGKFRAPPP
jgi:hypothetical protein